MNLNPNVVDTAGRELYSVGGEQSYATYSEGDYIVSLEWFTGKRTSEPIMVIWNARGGVDAGVFGICLSSIGKYADPSGRPAPTAMAAVAEALPVLGRALLGIEVSRLLDVILKRTPDLIAMPPAPMVLRRADAGTPLLEVERRDGNDKTIAEVVL